jgi:hypothetical protein
MGAMFPDAKADGLPMVGGRPTRKGNMHTTSCNGGTPDTLERAASVSPSRYSRAKWWRPSAFDPPDALVFCSRPVLRSSQGPAAPSNPAS